MKTKTTTTPGRPEDTFEIHGYYEELVAPVGDRWQVLGTRRIEKPIDRELGSGGKRSYVFTAPFVLSKGAGTVRIRASVKKPVACEGYAQAICGRLLTAKAHPQAPA